jgi:hypothetical protein
LDTASGSFPVRGKLLKIGDPLLLVTDWLIAALCDCGKVVYAADRGSGSSGGARGDRVRRAGLSGDAQRGLAHLSPR